MDAARPSSEACLAAIEQHGGASDEVAWALRRADAHHRLGRPGEAEAIYLDVLASQPDHLWAIGRLGVITASTGRVEEARSWDDRLSSFVPEYGPKGGPTLYRAKIALALGDDGRAVELLRLAVNEGLIFFSAAFGSPFHVDIDLEPLFGHPDYQKIVAPKR